MTCARHCLGGEEYTDELNFRIPAWRRMRNIGSLFAGEGAAWTIAKY